MLLSCRIRWFELILWSTVTLRHLYVYSTLYNSINSYSAPALLHLIISYSREMEKSLSIVVRNSRTMRAVADWNTSGSAAGWVQCIEAVSSENRFPPACGAASFQRTRLGVLQQTLLQHPCRAGSKNERGRGKPFRGQLG